MKFLSYFSIRLPFYLVYMAQQVEYEPDKFLAWLKRGPDLSSVMHRGRLVPTKKASLLAGFQFLSILIYLIFIGIICSRLSLVFLFLILFIPIVSVIALVLAIYAGRAASAPGDARKIKSSRGVFARHKALKIAILGSYGKTTMKELLLTVLGESKKVRATPGNKNVPISHARWSATLDGDEEVLLIEFGEAGPGDIAAFCKNTSPGSAVITGVAPNHLDRYKTVDAVADDLFSIVGPVDAANIYAHMDNYITGRYKSQDIKTNVYSEEGTARVKINNVKISIDGMSFTATVGNKKKTPFHTKLIGRHLLGPLAVCIEIADSLGLNIKQIQAGISKTRPFEHRMQPREINGAWIIDDTYNGSLEGFRAGLELLKELKAKRKVYVTPGLVDQGAETESVHTEIGRLIVACNPHKVVLINNSTTGYISNSLEKAGYKGEVDIRDDPLEFYINLEHTLAAGDLALLQNDWTDNYY